MAPMFSWLFRSKMTPEILLQQFREKADAFDTAHAERNYDLKRLKGRIDGILDSGKKAAQSGDSMGKRKAAMELKAVQIEVGEVERDLIRVINAKTFSRLTLGQLERCNRTHFGKAYEALGGLMKDTEFQRLMTEMRYSTQEMEIKISAALGQTLEQMPEEVELMDVDTSMFDELAEADRMGDVEKVQEIKRKAGARIEAAVGENVVLA
jgi:hypothetical protein